jgi:hypothetical protein
VKGPVAAPAPAHRAQDEAACAGKCWTEFMQATFSHLTTLALIAVLAVLLLGFWNMLRGSNPNVSQTLMRWRVGLQFLAIIIVMITVYLTR